jgi:nucleoside-diphosphate-sugar epimerase
VHWSTCGVFGKPFTVANGKAHNIPFTEESSSPRNMPFGSEGPEGTKLVNEYSVSKWEQEQLAWREHREHGLPLTVVRPAPVYGPGSDYGHGGIILAIAKGLLPAIPADSRDFITTSVHVDDIAGFAIYAAEHEQTLGEDYNVVDNSIVSYHEFIHYIALLTGRRIRDLKFIRSHWLRPGMYWTAAAWTYLERRFGVPRLRVFETQSTHYVGSSYWLSNRKSQAAGYEYSYPEVREGLRDTIAWMANMGWL